MNKLDARTYVKTCRNALSAEDVHRKSQVVLNWLMSLPEYQENNNILAYASFLQEVETWQLIEESLSRHKNVYVPKVYAKEIKFHQITALSQLQVGYFGISEPDQTTCATDLQEGFMIMPGLAFDRKFNRIGYGGGYYDRYLADRSNIIKAAVCFDFQLLDEIEAEPHDITADIIICESGIIKKK